MRKMLVIGPLLTTAMAVVIPLSVAAPAEAARGWTAHFQCTKKRISDDTAHGFVQGHGTGKTASDAKKAAKKNANDQMPRGYRAKHCTQKSVKQL
ncbi:MULTISPECIES: hypothetical protein [unclassified Streptomyces]|uniref:hypothetical protein n=3 Tax=unclassified Streptomyces TaxID=2593676 RepID=UPI0026B1C388|nr:hypothetical protein [Streptomyces sp. DSM 40167]